jgi:hypothetical protein
LIDFRNADSILSNMCEEEDCVVDELVEAVHADDPGYVALLQ